MIYGIENGSVVTGQKWQPCNGKQALELRATTWVINTRWECSILPTRGNDKYV